MFLNGSGGYSGEDQVARGDFLILSIDVDKKQMRGAVRYVRMRQLGHWMMGSCRLFDRSVSLSGCYGGDGLGLSDDLTEAEWESLMPLPQELYNTWATGGGHNSCGAEGYAVKDWALEHMAELKKAGKLSKEEKRRIKRATELFGFWRPGTRLRKDPEKEYGEDGKWNPPRFGNLIRVQPDKPREYDGPWHGCVEVSRDETGKELPRYTPIEIRPSDGWKVDEK